MGIFDSDDNEDLYGLNSESPVNEESDGLLVDISKPITKPSDFDTLCALCNHYEDMEMIIESLRKSEARIKIDENPDDENAECYTLDKEYSALFIELLEKKMTEIRNILNYN